MKAMQKWENRGRITWRITWYRSSPSCSPSLAAVTSSHSRNCLSTCRFFQTLPNHLEDYSKLSYLINAFSNGSVILSDVAPPEFPDHIYSTTYRFFRKSNLFGNKNQAHKYVFGLRIPFVSFLFRLKSFKFGHFLLFTFDLLQMPSRIGRISRNTHQPQKPLTKRPVSITWLLTKIPF